MGVEVEDAKASETEAIITFHPTPGMRTAVGRGGQATKGARWMSWHREAKKDVVAYDIPREAGKQASIRGSPNRETGLGLLPVTLT